MPETRSFIHIEPVYRRWWQFWRPRIIGYERVTDTFVYGSDPYPWSWTRMRDPLPPHMMVLHSPTSPAGNSP